MARIVQRWAFAVALLAATTPNGGNAQTLIHDAETEQLLYDIVRPLNQAAGLPEQLTRLIILADPAPNAFALQSGGIALTTGLIGLTRAPSLIQGVVAHEMGHFLGRHHATRQQASGRAQLVNAFAFLLGAAAIASKEPDAGFALLTLAPTVNAHLLAGFSRRQESQADQSALRILEAANLSPHGIIEVFSELATHETALRSAFATSPYLATHPTSLSRIEELERRAHASPAFNKPDNPDLVRRLDRVRAKLEAFLDPNPTASIRTPLPDNATANERLARATRLYRARRLQDASAMLSALADSEPRDPYLREFLCQTLLESGEVALARKNCKAALLLASAKNLIAHELLVLQYARALATHPDGLHAAIKQLTPLTLSPLVDIRATAWSRLATAHGALGDTANAELALAQRAAATENPARALRHAQHALKGLNPTSYAAIQARDIVSWAKTKRSRSRKRAPPTDENPH